MSIFKCFITYKKVEGNSYLSTKNKLISQGMIDDRFNVKGKLSIVREAINELNQQASEMLKEDVSLFKERELGENRIRLSPARDQFLRIDSFNRYSRELKSSPLPYLPTDVVSEMERVFVEKDLERLNQVYTDREYSLVKVDALDGYLLKTTYKPSYLSSPPAPKVVLDVESPIDSHNNFNLPCIIR